MLGSGTQQSESVVCVCVCVCVCVGFPPGTMVKNPSADLGDPRDTGSNPALGRSPGGRNGNLLQYFCLENSKDRGAWQATVHGVAKSQT